jgi:hypothetical protein
MVLIQVSRVVDLLQYLQLAVAEVETEHTTQLLEMVGPVVVVAEIQVTVERAMLEVILLLKETMVELVMMALGHQALVEVAVLAEQEETAVVLEQALQAQEHLTL